MSEVGDKVKKAVYEKLDVPGLMGEMLDEVLGPALDKVVKSTSNPFDDILKAAVYPELSNQLKNLFKDKWDELMAP